MSAFERSRTSEEASEIPESLEDGNDLSVQVESLQAGMTALLESIAAKEKAIEETAKLTQETCDKMMKHAKRKVEALRSEAAQEIAAWEKEKAELAHTQQFQPKVKLDVGGCKYTTSLTTLCRFPDTMIGAMFSGRHALPLDEDGYHFIDRDGTHFRLFLNYLRSPETFSVDLTGTALKEFKNECDYYGILDLIYPELVTHADLTGYEQNYYSCYTE